MSNSSVITKAKDKTAFSNILLAEKIFTIIVLFISTYAVIPHLRKNLTAFDPFKGDIFIQSLWAAIYILAFFLLYRRWHYTARIAFLDKTICFLVGLAFISAIWSDAPLVTLRRSTALLGTTVFGIYLATRYTGQELLKMLLWTLGLSAVLSIVFVLFLPSYGIHTIPYQAWRGVYENRNSLGCYMTLAVIGWLLYSLNNHRVSVIGLAFCLISLFLLISSKSATALVVMFLLILLLFIYGMVYNHKKLFIVFIIAAAGVSFFWLTKNVDYVFNVLGRDATLSGRTVLWQAIWDMVMHRPLLGYGYSAFWLGWNGPSSNIWSALSTKIPHAHNGYLDLWLQLGLAGLIIFLLSLFTNLYNAYRLVLKKGFKEILPLLFFFFMLVYNITESFILIQNSILWILYTAFSFQLKEPSLQNNKKTVSVISNGNIHRANSILYRDDMKGGL